jgi:hypothetical protein
MDEAKRIASNIAKLPTEVGLWVIGFFAAFMAMGWYVWGTGLLHS